MRLLDRLASPFKEFGAAAGALYLLDRLLRATSSRLGLHVYELMVQPIVAKPLLPPRLSNGLEFREIAADDPAVAEMPARAEIKASRFAQGATCLGAYRKGVLIGYLWFCRERYLEDEVRCTYMLEPAGRSVFDFDLYVMPAHRMGLGFIGLWHGANQYLHERGIVHTYSRLTRFNLASRRAHAHLGWRCVGKAVFLRLGSAELMFATVAPFVAFTLLPDRRVTIRLRPPRTATEPATATAAKDPTP